MNIPKKGFYYHYKHTPDSINNFAYEVIGIAQHSENEDLLVLYRRLYTSEKIWARPLAMFLEEVTKNGKTFPRFTKINNPAVISELNKIKEKMYN